MRTIFKGLLAMLLTGCFLPGSVAQENRGVPADVYYLMPAFGQGTIWFSDRGPAQGKLNICAEDNTLRFLDDKGQELVAESIDHVLRVQIDTVLFIRKDDVFYRVQSVSPELALAVRRDLDIQWDAKKGAYGTYSRTSSIRQYSTLYADGVVHQLNQAEECPYSVSESYFLYTGGAVVPFNRRNLRKQFPQRKDDLDAFLKSGHTLPDQFQDIHAFLLRLVSGEAL